MAESKVLKRIPTFVLVLVVIVCLPFFIMAELAELWKDSDDELTRRIRKSDGD